MSSPATRVAHLTVGLILLTRSVFAADFHLAMDSDRVSITADAVPTEIVLTELARHSGLVLLLYTSLEQPISLDMQGVSFSYAIRHILRDYDFLLLTDSDGRRKQLSVIARADQATSRQVQDTREIVLQHPDAWLRAEAVHTLADLAAEEAIPALAEAILDEAEEVKQAAIAVLNDFPGAAAVEVLSSVLRDPDPAVREEALYALADIGGVEAIGLLKHGLADPDDNVREAAVEILETLEVQE